MSETRKRKFRKWAQKGRAPKRAPLKEKFAFGAWKTNKGKRNEKAAKLQSKGSAKRIITNNTRGWQKEYRVNEPITILDDNQWRGKISSIGEDFRKRKRGKVVFIRLRLSLSLEITYATLQMEESEDGFATKWFGSREGHDSESTRTSFHELCDMVLEKIGESRDGMVDMVSIYTLRRK